MAGTSPAMTMREGVRLFALSAALLLGTCAAPGPGRVPPFAAKPYEPFVRANAVAIALNTQAGAEAVLRLQHLRFGNKAVLYSRSGAGADQGVVRSAGGHGVSWTEAGTQFITLVLRHSGDGQLVLVTAYPNLESIGDHKVAPPAGADLLEIPVGRFAVFWHGKQG